MGTPSYRYHLNVRFEGNPVPSGLRGQTQKRQRDAARVRRFAKLFLMHNFHGVLLGNSHRYTLRLRIGKVSILCSAALSHPHFGEGIAS